jgi:hypothetical protein
VTPPPQPVAEPPAPGPLGVTTFAEVPAEAPPPEPPPEPEPEPVPVAEPEPEPEPEPSRPVGISMELDPRTGELVVHIDDPDGAVRVVKRAGTWVIEGES